MFYKDKQELSFKGEKFIVHTSFSGFLFPFIILNNSKPICQNTRNKSYRPMLQKLIKGPVKHYDEAFQPAITCSDLTIETLEQGVKYVQS